MGGKIIGGYKIARINFAALATIITLNAASSLGADFSIFDARVFECAEQLELRELVDPLPSRQPWASGVLLSFPDSVKPTVLYQKNILRLANPVDGHGRGASVIDGWLSQGSSQQAVAGQFRTGLTFAYGKWSMAASYQGLFGDDHDYYYGYDWRGVRAKSDQVYLRWSENKSFFQLGKDYYRYGLGMALAGNQPFESLQGAISLGENISLHGFSGKLDGWLRDSVFVNRYLAGHRIQFSAGFLQIGVSEFAIYGGPGRALEPYYLLPLYIFLGEQDNRQIDDNIIWDLDFRMVLPPFRLQAELMVDDFQIEKKSAGDLEPTEAGIGVRADWGICSEPFYLSTMIDYKMVTNWTFNQNKDWNRFLFEGQPLGPSEGNDFERATWCLKAFGMNWQANTELYLLRCGQGNIDDPWTSPWVNDSTWTQSFPSGVIEKTTGVVINLEYNLPIERFWGWSAVPRLYGRWDWKASKNAGHVSGEAASDWNLKVGIGADLSANIGRW